MKKSLFAFAAVTAFAGAAQAQSSVTVYGILDVGYTGSNSSTMNTIQGNGQTAATNSGTAATINYPKTTGYTNGTLKNSQSLFGQSAEQTSRLGFKGSEDLGGGMSAFFTAEFGLAPEEQTLSGNTSGGLKNRQTFVGLKKAGLGDAAIGVQYTPVHISVGKTDPGQQNNMTGSVIYTGQADSGVLGANGGNTNAYTSRVGNSLTLNTEVFSGLQGHAIVIANNNTSSATSTTTGGITAGGNSNQNGWGLGADFTYKKFFVTGSYQAIKQLNSVVLDAYTGAANASYSTSITGTATNGNLNTPQVCNAAGMVGPVGAVSGASTSNANGLSNANQCYNIQDNQGYVGATYDFGILKAYASWITRKATDAQNSGISQKRQAEQIGVRSFVTPTVEAWASAGVGTFTPMGYNQNSAHFNAWQLGSNYWLSKRTNIYAIYGQYAQANSTYSLTTAATQLQATAVNQTNVNANSYAVGIRHTF